MEHKLSVEFRRVKTAAMQTTPHRKTLIRLGLLVVVGLQLACVRSLEALDSDYFSVSGTLQSPGSKDTGQLNQARQPGAQDGPILSPTPDDPHPLPANRSDPDTYVVQAGDTLGIIGQKYGVSVDELSQANNLANPNVLEVGQSLVIPVADPQGVGPDFKIIPDSELVNGPMSADFDVEGYINEKAGFLAGYSEDINDVPTSGAEVLQKVSLNYSVNPRLLLAVLEHQSGWVTQQDPGSQDRKHPIGVGNPQRKGLYRELAWAANTLNQGYYLWRVNGVANWVLSDGITVPIAATINAGTAAVQFMYSQLYGSAEWTQAVSEAGLFATYNRLFGYPFHYAVEPLLPHKLEQPPMQLPFETGKEWAFTGGPHGGWDSGSAWAALDFAPPGDALGCVPNNDWVVAVADGVIVRTGEGQVVQDLDGDGHEQTGWVVFYMHIENRGRVKPGTRVQAGDPIGHASCEGGVSSGTHVHLARKYNGEWIPADQEIPFVLDGWVSSGTGTEYDGFLSRTGKTLEAYAGRSENNQIKR
jgi:murein DD-endopeptidase MepM/ murein hydrolase activator NlpD